VVPLRGSARILVVDDNQGVLEEAVEQLTSLGYRVISAQSGAEALALLETDDGVDLLFTDVVMPGELAGRALAAKAMEMRPGLKVLFASGYFEGALVGKGQLETDVQFLAKPYRRKELAQKIEQVLSTAS
jgi:CheY-like chemotaxis protein